ncbi:MAG: hypothetical protein GY707_10075, partial [Desulfobacteraceae bacterium]|nr:hypothetical protein [Desulfobacteraceae bacterium]
GDYVWYDEDADGIQDGNEPGVEGVTVYLIDNTDGDTIATDVTDDQGAYLFEDVPFGEYVVAFDPSTATDGLPYEGTTANAGDGTNDSDPNPITGVTDPFTFDPTQGSNLDVDAGYTLDADIGDYVWYDEDQDGTQDGNELGIEGVTVYLVDNTDGDTIATDVTDDQGAYLFEDVLTGDYTVIFDVSTSTDGLPYSGTSQDQGDEAFDSDANASSGATDPIAFDATQGDDLTIDAGFTLASDIGDYVWYDEDADGIQDGNEPGVEGVTVYLIDNTDGDTIATDVTDDQGA